MNFHETIISQYRAALEMLKRTILACPETLWHSADDGISFWQVAYHALYYTHLYLQEADQAFTPWSGHREEYHFGNEAGAPPAGAASKEVVLAYLAFCQQEVVDKVPATVLEAPSGFDWLPFTKFELQLYSIRHIQQHAGELMERLGSHAGAVGWVGHMPR